MAKSGSTARSAGSVGGDRSNGALWPRLRRWWPLLLVVLLASCSQVRYYGQLVRGGTSILLRREPIDRLLERGRVDDATAERLRTVLAVREFAVEQLALPDNRSYRSYVEIDARAVVWNVVAAPRLSVEPRTWCFLVAGCVSYRGYFSEAAARRYAQRLVDRGWDVSVEGVTAYSTLGWFADPVLSTFLRHPDPQLAGLIFHELAHQVAYLPGDTTFNESFATLVELEGLERWLDSGGRAAEFEAVLEVQRAEREFVARVLETRDRLAELYDGALPDAEKLEEKRRLLLELRDGYFESQGPHLYAEWFERELNNAHLVSIGSYNDLVPAFRRLLERCEDELPCLYREVRRLADLDPEQRSVELGVAAAD